MKDLFKMKFQKITVPTSEARSRLAEAIEARQAADARLASLSASIARLAAEESAPSQAEHDLSRLQAEADTAYRVWAESADGSPAPEVDGDRLETLTKAHRHLTAGADAARRAKAGLEATYSAEAMKICGVDSYISAGVAEVIADEAAGLADGVIEAGRELALRKERLVQALDTIRTTAHGLPAATDASRRSFEALARLAREMERAFAAPMADLDAASASRMAWSTFESALRSDAGARLEA